MARYRWMIRFSSALPVEHDINTSYKRNPISKRSKEKLKATHQDNQPQMDRKLFEMKSTRSRSKQVCTCCVWSRRPAFQNIKILCQCNNNRKIWAKKKSGKRSSLFILLRRSRSFIMSRKTQITIPTHRADVWCAYKKINFQWENLGSQFTTGIWQWLVKMIFCYRRNVHHPYNIVY